VVWLLRILRLIALLFNTRAMNSVHDISSVCLLYIPSEQHLAIEFDIFSLTLVYASNILITLLLCILGPI